MNQIIYKKCGNSAKYAMKLEKNFLTNYIPKICNFYGLLKIHKFEKIKDVEKQKSKYIEIPNLIDLKFRPIVADPSCLTKRLGKRIDILLQPFLCKIKSYIGDDTF